MVHLAHPPASVTSAGHPPLSSVAASAGLEDEKMCPVNTIDEDEPRGGSRKRNDQNIPSNRLNILPVADRRPGSDSVTV